MKRLDYFLLVFLLALGLLLRLYKINTPLADFHSWRQADTASVARNFVEKGFDLIHPKYDDLSNVQSGFDNPEGYRMVEFPVYNAIFAYLYKLYPSIAIEVWGRITSVFFSLIIIATIYYLTLMEWNRRAAFFSAFIYAVFPFFVFYSRVVLPETTALSLVMISIFLMYFHTKKEPKLFFSVLAYVGAALAFALSVLAKPTTIFYGLPIAYLFFRKYGKKTLKNIFPYLFFLISLLPLLWWRSYIKAFPQGIPTSEWLFTSVNSGGGLRGIFFRPAFFRWIFFERINNMIFGGFMTIFFGLGLFLKQKKLLLTSILSSALIFLFVFQGGSVQHEYYQILILPGLAIFAGLGISYLLEKRKELIPGFPAWTMIVFLIFFSWSISYYQVKSHYDYSPDLVSMAKIVNSLTAKDDKIVTDTTGDTTLLYLANRRGAPAIYKNPPELKKLGYLYLATSSESEINQLKNEFYQVAFESEKLTIFKL